MLKKILAGLALLYAAASFAAVDVNKATPADLDGIKGVGPVVSKRILNERKKGEFKNWDDFVARIKGVGPNTAARLSNEGLTVNGEAFKKAAATEKKDDKKAVAKDVKTPAAKDDKKPATTEKKDDKAVAATAAASAKK
jgi:competence protein ComEA